LPCGSPQECCTQGNVFKLAQPGTFTDSLTDILRDGALAARTLEAPIAAIDDALTKSSKDECVNFIANSGYRHRS
jgi:hypothetical protein